MRSLAFALAVVGLAVVVFFAYDPSYRAMREDRAQYERSLQQLDLAQRSALAPVAVTTQVFLSLSLFVALGLVGWLVVDVYRLRRLPLVRPDIAGRLPVARSALVAGDYDQLVYAAAAAAAVTDQARAVHQPGQVPVHMQFAPSVHMAPHYAQNVTATGAVLSSDVSEVAEGVAMPSAPSWAALLASGYVPTRERLLLGYGAEGPLYGTLADLLSTAIAGRPRQGKSTLLRFVYVQLRQLGAGAVVWDLHGSIAEDVPGCDVAETVEAVEASAAALVVELDTRLASRSWSAPLLLLVDEWPALSLASRSAAKAIARVVLEGRKVEMFALIAGQGLPADRFGGSLVRDALSSRYVFRTTVRQAQMAGLEGDAAKLVLGLSPGLAVLAGPVDPQIVSLPVVLPQDLEVAQEVAEVAQEVAEVAEVAETDVTPAACFSADELGAEVRRRHAAGEVKSLTIRELWRVTGGRRFTVASKLYDELVG